MVLAWLRGKKLPTAKRADRTNELATARDLPEPFEVVDETLPPTQPGDRLHRERTFRNRELGIVVRAYKDAFLFARAVGVTVATVYRWAARLHEPRAHLSSRVNELARAKELAEPFPMRERSTFKGRGRLGAVIRAYGGVTRFAKASGASETRIRAWARERKPNPLLEIRERVNALARAAKVAEPFSRTRTVRFRGRGPLADLIRACGGVAGLARAASVGETSVYRWIRGTPPWRSVAREVNELARNRELAEPFDIAKCPIKTEEDAAVVRRDPRRRR
jgi:hypothetical protein